MGKTTSFPILILIIVVLLIVDKSTICCIAFKNNVTLDCFPREREALLSFKASFSYIPSDNMLSSWKDNSNCCAWPGVECDNAAKGHVVGLHLRCNDSRFNSMLSSEAVDSSLLELKYLRYLDLSGNNFSQSRIPSFLGSMKQLQYLNLSDAGFAGVVPYQLGNLSSLRILDLREEPYKNSLVVDDLTWAINISSLEYLDMSYVSLSTTKDLSKVLGMLHSLVELHLKNCGLDNTNLALTANYCSNSTLFLNNLQYLDLSRNSLGENFSFCFLHNMTSLSFLDISYNNLHASIPSSLGDLRDLRVLDIRGNNLFGPIPSTLGNLRDLNVLSLYANNLSGPIPFTLGNLKNLNVLDLGDNNLSGPIPYTLGNLIALRVLRLEDNNLSGPIPFALGNLRNLNVLNLGYNNLSGPIPYTLGNLSVLRVLNLYNNQLSGEIPISLGQLSNLESIDISFNALEGTISEVHFAKLSKLMIFYVGSNYELKFRVGYDWKPPFCELQGLNMRSVEIGGQFPQWLKTQKLLYRLILWNCSITGALPKWLSSFMRLSDLVLSDNHIEGPIPDSLCEIKTLLRLDLSKNQLSGNLPHCFGDLESLYITILSNNKISGPIPNSIGQARNMQWLQLNNNSITGEIQSSLQNCTMLVVLDIGDNMLYGNLPEWIGSKMLSLTALRLRNNKFYGDIPSSYCQFSAIQIMDLANNQLTGNIPSCFGSFSGMVNVREPFVVSNPFVDLSLSEMMKGVVREYTKTLGYLVNLDLSSNRLTGKIPSELTKLIGLNGLSLSHNYIEGTIPEKIGDLKSLESLDLSSNSLQGKISQSLSKLTFLAHLNLSNNDLSGRIPTGPQLQTLNNPSSYEGNTRLCGDPLPKKCHIANNEPPESRKVDKIYLYASIITGIATGFWGYFGILVFKRSWRIALFKHIDALIGKMLGRY